MISIKRYLLVTLMTILFIVTLIVCTASYTGALDEMNELFDGHLKQIATVLRQQPLLTGTLKSYVDQKHVLKFDGEDNFLIQIWETDDLVYSSYPQISSNPYRTNGFHTEHVQNQKWRSYTIHDGLKTIQVSQPQKGRHQMAREISFRMLIPIIAQFPLLGLSIWFAVRRSLRPLVGISSAIHERTPDSLAPINMQPVPSEIQPLVLALNNLLIRLDSALSMQKQFTADAAHELRTPLTAVQLQLEILMRAKNDSERNHALGKLEAGVKRSIHLAKQLLTAAHSESNQLPDTFNSVEMNSLVSSLVDQFEPIAHEKFITITAGKTDKHLFVYGNADKIQILLSNLLDNAVRYTPDHGKIVLALGKTDKNIILSVADNGPGIPTDDHDRVFDRFYRLIGTKISGTGLGLSIVKTIADQHDATITLGSGLDERGLHIAVHFPIPQSPAV